MRKRLAYLSFFILGVSAISTLPQIITIARFDVRANDRKVAELNTELAGLRSEYLKILFDGIEPEAHSAGFVVVSEARYLNPASVVAER